MTEVSQAALNSPPRTAGRVTSMCLGQDMVFDPLRYVRQFQGCVGGPSASDTFDVGVPACR